MHESKIGTSNLQLRGDLIMLVVTLFWGASYLFIKIGLTDMGAYNLIALRFGIAFLLASLVFYKRMRKTTWLVLKHSALLGIILFAALAVVTIGVQSTSASNAGFLFSLAVVFVPLLVALIYKKRLQRHVLIGVFLSFVGICLMTMTHGFGIHMGDLLIILGALLYAIYILVTDRVASKVDALVLGIWQLGYTAVFATVFSFLFETPQLPQTTSSWLAILALGILCSACGFIGQTIAQQYTTPIRTGLIFSLEPVFTVLFSLLFLHEVLSTQAYVGASFMLFGVVISKLDFRQFHLMKRLDLVKK
ncbi:DMT family transporter [Kurthia senegalensis]|uniref:DMT family transporter n=1 Tax=Kurthia senegalensis TaxID=1033740 RepID=UPI000288D995|nr:DMT family transporter [Kurthia senegalensis]